MLLSVIMFQTGCPSANKQAIRSPEKIDEEKKKDDVTEQELQKKEIDNQVDKKMEDFNKKVDEE